VIVSERKKPQVGVRAKEWERRNDAAAKRRKRQPEDDFMDDLRDSGGTDEVSS
jgi:hypothetical protein